ncbi:DNA polymerase III subunit beta [Lignipirellula cremea]|uniref:Beta sliding clamp n=1 Tax=Lignipirellula cremea TaxID=2528010 RepID=A0A518DK98_9BACT|nr:DNA polymerase III subunit beta [Lignipirellula cremea]QDU92257.1 DNA polymerase III subunit beta [Lignipirellula cremea]
MKLTCDREKFFAAFQIAAAVAPSRSPKPILQSVKLDVGKDEAMLTATDMEVGIRVQASGVTVEQPGAVILPVSRVAAILRESTDDRLDIEADEKGAVIRGQRSEFKLPVQDPSEFPQVAAFNEEKLHELKAGSLRELIRRTSFATDVESARYALGGVLFEFTADGVTAVGTDGRRLAKMECAGKAIGGHEVHDATTIIPTRAAQLIERTLAALAESDDTIQIAARANDVLVRCGAAVLYSRLVEGRFPKWRDVFPQRTNAVKIPLVVGPAYSALRQASIVASNESRGIDFQFGQGSLVLSGSNADHGAARVEMPIPYDGEPITLTLDHRYLADFFKVLDAEKTFTCEIESSDTAALCTTDDGYGYVIMPLQRDRR